MKKILFVLALSILANAGEEAVTLTKEKSLKIIASCASDEEATVDLKQSSKDSQSELTATIVCKPYQCIALEQKGKTLIYRSVYEAVPNINGFEKNLNVLKSGLPGGKTSSLQAAQDYVNQGVCRTARYTKTNGVFKFINSL